MPRPHLSRIFNTPAQRKNFVPLGVTVNFEVRPYARCLDDTRRGRLVLEIRAMQQTFGPGIADAMWRFNGR